MDTVQMQDGLVYVPYEVYTVGKKQFGKVMIAPIDFVTESKQSVPLVRQPSDRTVVSLHGGDVPLFANFGTKYTIVLKFPGYPVFSRQKYSSTGRGVGKAPNDRVKTLAQVAEVMEDFLEEMKYQDVTGPLKFGNGGIELRDLYLLQLRQVSRASFQPIFAVQKHRAAWVCM